MSEVDDWLVRHDRPLHCSLPAFDPWVPALVTRDAPGSGVNFRKENLVPRHYVCRRCGTPFTSDASWALFCSKRCFYKARWDKDKLRSRILD